MSVLSQALQALSWITVLCVDQASHGTSAKFTRSSNMLLHIYSSTAHLTPPKSLVGYECAHCCYVHFIYKREREQAGSTQQSNEHVSCCPNFIGKLSYSAAAKEHTNSPCTNVLVTCPLPINFSSSLEV